MATLIHYVVGSQVQFWTDPRTMAEIEEALNDAIDRQRPFIDAMSPGPSGSDIPLVINADHVLALQEE